MDEQNSITLQVHGNKRYHVWAQSKAGAITQAQALLEQWAARWFSCDIRDQVTGRGATVVSAVCRDDLPAARNGDRFWTVTFRIALVDEI